MKSIVIYNSKRGSTEQYARWIAEDIKAEQCIALEHADFHALDQFDVVVFGGWIRGSGIVGLDKLKKSVPEIFSRLVIFGVGISRLTPENYMQIVDINLNTKDDRWNNVPLHVLPGRYDPSQVAGLDKFLMAVSKRVMISGRVSDKDQGAMEMKAAIEKGVDRMDRKAVEPVVKSVYKICGISPVADASDDSDVDEKDRNSGGEGSGQDGGRDPADTDAIMREMLSRHDQE